MAFDLVTKKQSLRDWSIGAGIEERRISVHEQAPLSALAKVPRESLRAPDRETLLEGATLGAYSKMLQAARQAGVKYPMLQLVSGFRSFGTQKILWMNELGKLNGNVAEARKRVAPPGHSTHATGRAVDLWLGKTVAWENVAELRKTPAYAWLEAHAGDYGFHPYEAEPWHWEYNPTPAEAARAGLSMPATGVAAREDEAPEALGEGAGTGSVVPVVIGALAVLGIGGVWWMGKKRGTSGATGRRLAHG